MPTTEEIEKDLSVIIPQIAQSFDDELFSVPADGLDEYSWFFKWDNKATLEWNIYQFHDLLKLHGNMCRRWEEHHNGCVCVVERVRDKYLMPKIRAFIEAMNDHGA